MGYSAAKGDLAELQTMVDEDTAMLRAYEAGEFSLPAEEAQSLRKKTQKLAEALTEVKEEFLQ